MKKWILCSLLVGLVVLMVSCVQPAYQPYTPTPNPPVGTSDTPRAAVEAYREPPTDVTWISPGKVMISNFYPGARAEWDLTIHNGNLYQAMFEVAYRYPDRVEEGYSMPSLEAPQWVIIADATPVLQPRATRGILIAVDLPDGAFVDATDWEFWISVTDMTQGGMVKTELCSRWLVSMRE